jgi:hypothetical protein
MKPAIVIERVFSKYVDVEDLVHNGVRFKTNVPWVAPKAYLHILFPPVSPEILRQRTAELEIPTELAEFYSQWNGADFFAGTLAIYGLLPDKYVINRGDWRSQIPFDLIAETRRWRAELSKHNLLCFGSYSYDRSPVCVSRDSGVVTAFASDRIERTRATWPSFEEFFSRELERLSAFFDDKGRCDFPPAALLPTSTIE